MMLRGLVEAPAAFSGRFARLRWQTPKGIEEVDIAVVGSRRMVSS
jgi:hypothetical protein